MNPSTIVSAPGADSSNSMMPAISDSFFLAPGIGLKTIWPGLQTTRVGNIMYERSGPTGVSLFSDPNVDVYRAGNSTGSVWRQIGQVDPERILTLPQLPHGYDALLPEFRTDSTMHMSEMRRLQGFFAEANFRLSALGRLPGELINRILELVVQEKDARQSATCAQVPSWISFNTQQSPLLGLFLSCRHLNQTAKRMIFGRAVLYFRTPDAVMAFINSQRFAPMTAHPVDYLHTVILDIQFNANWPLITEVKGIITPLPTDKDGWETRIIVETPSHPSENRVSRYTARSDKTLMTEDWAEAAGMLLRMYGVKNLIVRAAKGFQWGLSPHRRLVRTLKAYPSCVENVIEVGKWPRGGAGHLVYGMVTAAPGEARARALQTHT